MGFKFSQLKTTFGKIQKQEKKEKQKGSGKEFIAKLSKGLMLPIAMLPIAGLFLGIGSAIVSSAGSDQGLVTFGNFLSVPGNAIFGALPLLFAIAIAIAFTNDAGPAALACFVGYLVFGGLQMALSSPVSVTDSYGTTSVIGYNLLFYTPGSMGPYSPTADNYVASGFSNGIVSYTKSGELSAGLPSSLFGDVIGLNQLQSSVFGGFLVGFIVAALYNKFKNIQLPTVIGFFSGVRFIPIVTFAALFPITIIFLMIWPLIGILLSLIGQGLGSAVGVNSFIFGYVERALVPFGLHHAFYSPLWYTSAGGSINMTQSAIIFVDGSAYSVNATANSTQIINWNQLVEQITQAKVGTANNPGTIAGDQTMWAFINANLLNREVYITPVNVSDFDFASGVYKNITTVSNAVATQHRLTWSDLTSGQQALGTKGANGFLGVNIGQYLQGKYSFMIFGLPAAAAAMIMAAPKSNRKVASSIVASAALTSALTGITEPIEYTFLFLAPYMFWGFHAFMCAFCFGMMNWIGIIASVANNPNLAPHIGMSFSGGIIDWIIYGAIQIPSGSNAWWALLLGIAIAPVYYFVFLAVIKKKNILTPGRGETTKLFTKADYQAKVNSSSGQIDLNSNKIMALNVIKAYGGFDNIKNVDACITKLRVQVANQSSVDTDTLMSLGARGTIKPSPQSLYAVFGNEADIIKNNMKDIIEDITKDPSKRKYYEDVIGDQNASVHDDSLTHKSETTKVSDEKIIIKSPLTGKIVPMSKVPDETFKQNLMGVGVAIEPTNGSIVSPIDGKLSLVFETGHAYSFESEKGTQVLIHVGIDSIHLKDEKGNAVNPFVASVATGDSIKTGASIGTVSLPKLKYAKSKITPVIVLNESLFGRTVKTLKKSGEVKKGEPIMEVSLTTKAPVKKTSSTASKKTKK